MWFSSKRICTARSPTIAVTNLYNGKWRCIVKQDIIEPLGTPHNTSWLPTMCEIALVLKRCVAERYRHALSSLETISITSHFQLDSIVTNHFNSSKFQPGSDKLNSAFLCQRQWITAHDVDSLCQPVTHRWICYWSWHGIWYELSAFV